MKTLSNRDTWGKAPLPSLLDEEKPDDVLNSKLFLHKANRIYLKLFSIIFTFIAFYCERHECFLFSFLCSFPLLTLDVGLMLKSGRRGALDFSFGSYSVTQTVLSFSHPLLTWDFRKPAVFV